ncbi:hypothetical protein E1267_40090 [Nonomuraea longispora]|uniref:Uncharacterized protein n=1 Tax=Nonomuraea longispora TaxID=1848320 RepID=A0A4R4MSX3_9ACTN|nr:hypothetical protein [Nonomuraea longispora]TDB97246.1 hypothetical protein E1267_40090 [Nonomuraea longispora]
MTAGLALTALATVTAGYLSSPAVAGTAGGQVTLFSGSSDVENVSYKQCEPPTQHQSRLAHVVSFDNRPSAGCHVVLVNLQGGTFTLCHGRGSVPAAFRPSPTVQIRPGSSNICLDDPGA